MSTLKWLEDQIDEAYEALDNLEKGNPTSWNGIEWDGNPEDYDGWDYVNDAIWDSIIELESELYDDDDEYDDWGLELELYDEVEDDIIEI